MPSLNPTTRREECPMTKSRIEKVIEEKSETDNLSDKIVKNFGLFDPKLELGNFKFPLLDLLKNVVFRSSSLYFFLFSYHLFLKFPLMSVKFYRTGRIGSTTIPICSMTPVIIVHVLQQHFISPFPLRAENIGLVPDKKKHRDQII